MCRLRDEGAATWTGAAAASRPRCPLPHSGSSLRLPLYTAAPHSPAGILLPLTYPLSFRSTTFLSQGVLSFESETLEVNESDGVVIVPILRTNGATECVSVRVRTMDGTAVAGPDYVAVDTKLTFSEGETRKEVTITLWQRTLSALPPSLPRSLPPSLARSLPPSPPDYSSTLLIHCCALLSVRWAAAAHHGDRRRPLRKRPDIPSEPLRADQRRHPRRLKRRRRARTATIRPHCPCSTYCRMSLLTRAQLLQHSLAGSQGGDGRYHCV